MVPAQTAWNPVVFLSYTRIVWNITRALTFQYVHGENAADRIITALIPVKKPEVIEISGDCSELSILSVVFFTSARLPMS
jgi:hypothetical protein